MFQLHIQQGRFHHYWADCTLLMRGGLKIDDIPMSWGWMKRHLVEQVYMIMMHSLMNMNPEYKRDIHHLSWSRYNPHENVCSNLMSFTKWWFISSHHAFLTCCCTILFWCCFSRITWCTCTWSIDRRIGSRITECTFTITYFRDRLERLASDFVPHRPVTLQSFSTSRRTFIAWCWTYWLCVISCEWTPNLWCDDLLFAGLFVQPHTQYMMIDQSYWNMNQLFHQYHVVEVGWSLNIVLVTGHTRTFFAYTLSNARGNTSYLDCHHHRLTSWSVLPSHRSRWITFGTWRTLKCSIPL